MVWTTAKKNKLRMMYTPCFNTHHISATLEDDDLAKNHDPFPRSLIRMSRYPNTYPTPLPLG